MQADNAYPPEGPEPAPDAARLSMVPTHAIPLDKEQPLDGSSSASNPTLVQKSDTLRGSSDVATVWDMDRLQEARLEMTPPTRKEHVIEGQYAIPLILQDDELLEAQQGAVSARAVDELARTAGGHDELMHDLNVDTFSDYGSEDSASFYDSLMSFAPEFYWENGRRYQRHQSAGYTLPNDQTELDREDMKHHEFMLITDFRLHLSPIGDKPQRILDIGTGTGLWAIQAAEYYPSAEVIGTDISPVQPRWVPPNLTFELDDLEEEWLYGSGTFDLVHIRNMFIAIKDYPAILAQAYKTLKSGGYVEVCELAANPQVMSPDSPPPVQTFRWLDLLNEAMLNAGFHLRVAPTLKGLLKDAGFVDIVETKFEIPWGAWPDDKKLKAIGFWHLEQLQQGLQGIIMKLFSRDFGWTPSEIETFIVGLRKELNDKSYCLLDHAYVVYGRKP